MPQKYQTERRYLNTFLKMLFYTHVLRRFDKPKHEPENDNLLVLWADEAQRFVTASDEGMSDYNWIDVMREARATLVAAAQSSTSFIPPLCAEKAKVFTLNLRNRLIFKAADEAGPSKATIFFGPEEDSQGHSRTHGGLKPEDCVWNQHISASLVLRVCAYAYGRLNCRSAERSLRPFSFVTL